MITESSTRCALTTSAVSRTCTASTKKKHVNEHESQIVAGEPDFTSDTPQYRNVFYRS